MSADLYLLIAPALEAYSTEVGRHQHDGAGSVCQCGFAGRGRVPRRSVGLHIAAAKRRASKAYDAETARLIAEASAAQHA